MQQKQLLTEHLGDDVFLEMVLLPQGEFLMGSNYSMQGYDSERPQQYVRVASFWMGKFPVTREQWQAVANLPRVKYDLNPDPSCFKKERRPVENVSWQDAVEFCDRLERKTGRRYRLPCEAEWEYACRAGTDTQFYTGDRLNPNFANYDARHDYDAEAKVKYRGETTIVGIFPANDFGLYDMHGNVWEWCADPWHETYLGMSPYAKIWEQGGDYLYRVLRGGSWMNDSWECRSANRRKDPVVNWQNYYGFRVALTLD